MTRTRIVALITVLVIIFSCFTSCGLFNNNDQGTGDTGNNNNENQGNVDGGSQDEKCSHATTKLVGEKEATCAEKGYTGDKVCTTCTTIVVPGSETPMIDHVFGEGEITKNPTCIETGVMTFTCSGCGTTKTESVATTMHDDVYHDAQDGTHFHTCTKCTLNEHGEHTPTNEGIVVAASCTEPSHTVYTCAECDGVYKIYSGSDIALDHELGEWVEDKAATCVSSGRKTQRCTREGCDYSHSVTLSATGIHTVVFSEYLTAPSCNADGVALYVCKYCTYTEQRDVAKTGVHNYVELESTGDGWNRKQCTACNDMISSFDASYLKEAELTTETINKQEALEVNVESAAIQFPKEVVGQITSGSDVAVSAGILDEEVKSEAINKIADEEQKAILENSNIYDFTVKVDGATFSQNFDSKVAITLNYDNGDGDEDGIVIYYLAENGEIETITDVVYNPETKEVTFFVSHFSYYAVAYRETQAMRCNRGVHEFVKTDRVVAPTCHSFGYTVYKCSYCGRETIDDMVSRMPHKYGDEIPANPTCDRADYVTRVCEHPGCNEVLQVKLVGATGHKINAPADCENHAICQKCGDIVTLAFGHNWTAWTIIVEPTAVKTGLRRRYCVNCGNKEESVLAASGNIETLEYNSYEELLEVILDEVIKLKTGKISFTLLDYNDIGLTVTADIMETDNGHRAYIKVEQNLSSDINDIEIYYNNGVMVIMTDDATQNGVGNLNSIFGYTTIDQFKLYIEEVYIQLDTIVEGYLTVVRDFLETYVPIYGDEINKVLASGDYDYDVHELVETINSIETIYAYLSLRLGYASAQQMVDGVVLPDGEDIRRFLEAFMVVTEENGISTYTLSTSPVIDAANDVVDFVKARLDYTLAEFIYESVEDYALEIDPTITNFNDLMDYIAKEFPGSFTVADAVNKYIDFAKEKDFVSIKTLYSLIDTIALEIYHQDIDCEKLVKQNSKMTLNELARQIYGSDSLNIQDLYDAIADNAHTVKFGDTYFRGATIAQYCEALSQKVDTFPVLGDITVSFDADGRLVGLTIDADLDPNYITFKTVNASIKYDDSVKVEIPEKFQPIIKSPTASYDKNGNLTVSGLPADGDYSFSVGGYAFVPLKDIVSKDDAVSAQMGKDVYVLNREYWNASENVGTYLKYNGKYYSTEGEINIYEVPSTLTLNELTAIVIRDYFGEMTDSGYTLLGRDDVPVYVPYWGLHNVIMYVKDGVTYYSSSYYRTYEGYCVFEECTEDELYKLVELKEVTDSYYRNRYMELDGKLVPLTPYRAQIGNSSYWNTYYGYTENGEIKIIDPTSNYRWAYLLDYANYVPELPDFDYNSEYDYNDCYAINADGSYSKIDASYVNLYKRVPSYYYQISDDQYFNINNYYYTPSVSGLNTMTLPDGNTLYILGTNTDGYFSGLNGYELTYGYAEGKSGIFVRAIAAMQDGKVVNVYYRDTSSTIQFSMDTLHADKYTTKNADGSYTLSAAYINQLNNMCEKYGYYTIRIGGTFTLDGQTLNTAYAIANYTNTTSQNVNQELDYNVWYELFDSNGGSDTPDYQGYDIVFNNNGTISLVFPDGVTVTQVYYHNSIGVSVEDLIQYDKNMSDSTGLEIYSYTTSYDSNQYSGDYVYFNGKYYHWTYNHIYDFQFDESITPTDWYVNGMTYRFDTVGAGDLGVVPVYETRIEFNYNDPYHAYYDHEITVYTIVIDGEPYALTGAEVTGESLLTFEGWLPFNEYMENLEFVVGSDSMYNNINYNGVNTPIYYASVYVYETDGNGNRLSTDWQHVIYREYVVVNGENKYICGYNTTSEVVLLDEADISHIPANAEKHIDEKFNDNPNYSLVWFNWVETATVTFHYIKLAGSFYRYDNVHRYDLPGSFCDRYLNEWDFNNQALSKVWYYVVIDRYTGEARYYTEFIPSDYGFTPSGIEVYEWEISGDLYSQTLLGYTADGNPMYEYAYWVNESSDNFEYTTEVQSDGTVFYHKDGKGYLKVTSKYGQVYYVEARKVTNADGTSEILCFLMGPHLTGNETSSYAEEVRNSKYIQIKGNTVTIKKNMVNGILNEYRDHGYIEIHISFSNGNSNWYNVDYYDILSWFNSI